MTNEGEFNMYIPHEVAKNLHEQIKNTRLQVTEAVKHHHALGHLVLLSIAAPAVQQAHMIDRLEYPLWTVDDTGTVSERTVIGAEKLTLRERLDIQRATYLHNAINPKQFPTTTFTCTEGGFGKLSFRWSGKFDTVLMDLLLSVWREVKIEQLDAKPKVIMMQVADGKYCIEVDGVTTDFGHAYLTHEKFIKRIAEYYVFNRNVIDHLNFKQE